MNLKRTNGMHTLVCPRCGLERKSPKPPGKQYTPKICAECNREDQREIMCKMLRQEFVPKAKRPAT